MSYPDIASPTFRDDLLYRQEFYNLRWDTPNHREVTHDPLLAKHLKINSHQLFVGNFMSPDTPYMRMHLWHTPGTGKTLAAIYVASKFIAAYRRIYIQQQSKLNLRTIPDSATPTVFVMGFDGTKTAFYRDLLKYPDFGFITNAEKDEFQLRQKLADSGIPSDIEYFKGYQSGLRRRITNKSRGGFYKFYGYDEFVNRLFQTDIKLTDVESAIVQHNKANPNDPKTLESAIAELIKQRVIIVNEELVAAFKNSIIICDEIHNTYNMYAKNNRGVAIQYILDTVPTVRYLSLSATPINSSPTEVIDWMNYLLPQELQVKRNDLFNQRQLVPGGVEKLTQLLTGRVSFLQDINIKYFPTRTFIGEQIRIPHAIGDLPSGAPIPYLVFCPCPMTKFHQATLFHYQSTGDVTSVDTEVQPIEDMEYADEAIGVTNAKTIPTDGFSLYDIAFPDPTESQRGMFRSGDIRNKLTGADPKWRDETGIYMRHQGVGNTPIITGTFLQKKNIAKYSAKFSKVISLIDDIFAKLGNNDSEFVPQKVMLYHDRVRTSGVLLLQELLLANGFSDETSTPSDNTRCVICGTTLGEHKPRDEKHKYRPARFVIAHSDIERSTMTHSLTKFNSIDNSHGVNFMVLIGSKIVRESYDFKCVQTLIMCSLPVNIPTFLQILGRCVRKNSHVTLPPAMRKVDVHILCSTIDPQLPNVDAASPEMYRYCDKLADYMIIQRIEQSVSRGAIDADMHRDIIMPEGLLKQYFPTGDTRAEPLNSLGALYFEPLHTMRKHTLGELPLNTFMSNQYYEEEVKLCVFIIKRLFTTTSVWQYESLLASVRNPPISLEINPKFILEQSFVCALTHLVGRKQRIIQAKPIQQTLEATLLDKLFDYNERYIYVNGQKSQIECIGKFYILFPVVTVHANPLNSQEISVRDREKILRSVPMPEHAVVDVEMYIRQRAPNDTSDINIDRYLSSISGEDYAIKRKSFVNKQHITVQEWCAGTDSQFQQRFLEESIEALYSGKPTKLMESVVQCMTELGAVITLKEISPYKPIVALFKQLPKDVPMNTPIGYTARACKLYDHSARTWVTVSKVALNRQVQYKENEIIIGVFETSDGSTKFKLRKPVQSLKGKVSDGFIDTRLIERGVVCASMGKTALNLIAQRLGIKVTPNEKIKNVCELIQGDVLKSEIRERRKESKYKYVYGWWDESPELKGAI